MCGCQRTRRELLVGALGAAALGLSACGRSGDASHPTAAIGQLAPVDALTSVEVAPGLHIHPRSDWGADLPPKGTMGPEEVRFLLVHHTASSNVVPDVREVIRQTYAFQTGPTKRWPDICYHFMVGPDGSVWETRAGSLAGPVVADATGGNQGFGQLVCLIGDFTAQAPTPAAQESLMRTLIFLADRYDIDTDPTATTTFVSRGSDKFPAGAMITTPTISGHRDVTFTACPGDLGYTLLGSWRSRVHATRLMHADPGPIKRAVRLNTHLT
jgi:N-acetylmuramoyl-L-alanine amidase